MTSTPMKSRRYDITPNWDAHIKYRSSSVDVDNYDDDVKGWQVGMGYKF